MELKYLGNSSFKMRFKSGMVLVTDPLDSKEKADIVTVSDADKNKFWTSQNNRGPVKREDVFVIKEEGEYEIGGVEVRAIKEGDENLIMVIRQNGITLCHLGNLSRVLSEKQIEGIGSVDVLLPLVGGKLRELISSISPAIVVPMYKEKKDLNEFLNDSSLEVMLENVDKVKIVANTLPENTKVMVLKP